MSADGTAVSDSTTEPAPRLSGYKLVRLALLVVVPVQAAFDLPRRP